MDVRHPLTEFDTGLLAWCAQVDMRVHVLLTKADKLSRGKGGAVLQKVRKELAAGNPGCTVQLFSALKGIGVEEARAVSLGWLHREIRPRADATGEVVDAAAADGRNSIDNKN